MTNQQITYITKDEFFRISMDKQHIHYKSAVMEFKNGQTLYYIKP
jgi:hypothetical protein